MDILGTVRRTKSPFSTVGNKGESNAASGATAPPMTDRMARVIDRLASADDATATRSPPVAASPLASSEPGRRTAASGPRALAKRVMDLVVAGCALAALVPVMIMVAILVRCQMGPGILFSQLRVGLDGRLFPCYKFRTMILGAEAVLADYLKANPAARAEWDANQKLKDDPRVTGLGRFLRKSSLDELPQLFNVLLGDMSCVGPRPVVQAELQRYGVHMTDYISMRPGLTGLWQVSGRSQLSYADRVALDAQYVRQWSLGRDIVILLRTIPAVAKFEEAA